jgi:alpha-L-arabinofuranosidase
MCPTMVAGNSFVPLFEEDGRPSIPWNVWRGAKGALRQALPLTGKVVDTDNQGNLRSEGLVDDVRTAATACRARMDAALLDDSPCLGSCRYVRYRSMKRLPVAALAVFLLFSLAACSAAISSPARSGTPTLTLDAGERGIKISPTLFGLMFEEINHSGDGGIYAELIANRAMLDNAPNADPNTPDATPNTDPWALETTGQALGSIDLDSHDPVNTTALTESLRLTISHVAPGERVGIVNPGYSALPVRPSTTYRVSFYARSGAGFKGPLSVSIESATTNKVFASAPVPAIGSSWRHYALTLTTQAGIEPSEDNHLIISATHTGKVWFSLVSLFPPTWNNRPNGMRIDLMRDLLALHPSFLRIPGGNYLEGQTVDTRFIWKNTLGNLSLRPGHFDDAWGYRSSDGLGLREYLEWCEDLHVIPVLGVFAGYTLSGDYIAAGSALKPYVLDALDELQYATGSTSTAWGARRAADGHPAPFKVPYVEIGNEDFFDQSSSYDSRFAQFYDAIRAAYPSIKLIATSTDVTSRRPDLIDLHFYETPDWFAGHTGYFDRYSRRAPRAFVGEYAARTNNSPIGGGPATLGTAIGEAAWMTGLERNSDVVAMASYAPLFQNVQPFQYQWTPDLISYDNLNSYGSPSYYVQQLFSINHGDMVVPTRLSGTAPLAYVASRDSGGTTMYLTVVNSGAAAQASRIVVNGVASVAARGTVTVLTSGSVTDENSLDAPTTVYPVIRPVTTLGRSFSYTFRPNSVTVFRLSIKPVSR